MKILIRNSDNIVMYADESMVLTAERVYGNSWQDFNFTAANARIAEAELPAMWCGAIWSYAGGIWTVVDSAQHEIYVAEETALAAARAAALVPASVTMRQARLALLNAGLLSTVNAAVAGMPGAAGDAARIEWEFSSTVERHRPLVEALGATLNLSDGQLNELFIAAAAL